jgi:uncharacterized phage-associated protein
MSYKSISIAQYVINYAIDNKKEISNLKLQKLLYYIQAAFLVSKNNPCIDEEFVNWQHGPVVEVVYDMYKRYSDRNITDYQTKNVYGKFDENFNFIQEEIEFNPNGIKEEDKNLINAVLDSLLDYGAWRLVEETHLEDPWLKSSARYHTITNESILNYFSNDDNEKRIYGEFS